MLHHPSIARLLAGSLLICLSAAAAAANMTPTIYMALWRGCETACESFKSALEERGIHATFIERNAAQDKSKLPGFVQEARRLQPDLILSWGTTATLGMVGRLQDAGTGKFITDIPVVYMIVSDAVGSGIIQSFEHTGRANVTGTHNRVPEEININAIRTYYPDFHKLGMLYLRTENNSVVKVQEIRELSTQMGFELIAIEIGMDAQNQPDVLSIPEKMQALKQQGADFINVGSSSFIEKNGTAFTLAALQAGLPVLSPYERLVTDAHALISVSARYDAVGRLAAEQAMKILIDGKQAGEIPVRVMKKFAFVINMDTARQLKLFPPIELLEIAETIH